MSFVLPDLVLESIVRDGLENARRDETVVDDVFGNLTRPFAAKKYGQSEIDKIKKLVKNSEVSVVHSFHMVEANVPCISIQMLSGTEETAHAYMGDFVGVYDVPITDPEKLAALVVVESFVSNSYDPLTGKITVPDSVNLAPVYANLLFADSAGQTFPVLGGIDNTAGQKSFLIQKQAEVTVGNGCEIKSSIDFNRFQKRGNKENVQLMVGIHTKDALTTKYLYTLVNYFFMSRKADLQARDFQLSTYNGSDFHRNLEYAGDVVYSRFLTVSGFITHDWRSDKVQLIDSVNVDVRVPADEFGNSALGLENMTVKTTKD
jgi:hypothetical protein